MKMKTECLSVLIGIACLTLVAPSQAQIAVSVNPAQQSILSGSSTFVNVDISGLHNQTAAIGLGGYYIDLTYDPTIVQFDGLVFGNGLNLGNSGDSLQNFDSSTLGLLHVDETSFLDSVTLLAGQPGDFNLFRIDFTGLMDGTTPVSLSWVDMSDVAGSPLTAAQTSDGSINVPDSLPFGWIAFTVGLVVIMGSRRQFAKT